MKSTSSRSIRQQLNETGAYRISESSGDFGIEIETEVKTGDEYPRGFLKEILMDESYHKWDIPSLPEWKGHWDGSLRDFGVEYVLREPLDFEAADEALRAFGEKTKDIRFHQNSPGTSVHVHTNLGKYSWKTLGNYLTVYSLYENVLAVHAGPSRTSNLFALPMRCAEENHDLMVDIFTELDKKSLKGIQRLSDDAFKYAGMNLAPLHRLGSVECRLMRGTTDADEIRLWLRILNEILEFAKGDITPKDIISEYRAVGDPLMKYIFKETHTSLPDPQRFVTDRSVFYAAWLSASVADWNLIELDKAKEQKTRKKSGVNLDELLNLAHGTLSNNQQPPSGTPSAGFSVDQMKNFGHSLYKQQEAINNGTTLATPYGMVKWKASTGKWVANTPQNQSPNTPNGWTTMMIIDDHPQDATPMYPPEDDYDLEGDSV